MIGDTRNLIVLRLFSHESRCASLFFQISSLWIFEVAEHGRQVMQFQVCAFAPRSSLVASVDYRYRYVGQYRIGLNAKRIDNVHH